MPFLGSRARFGVRRAVIGPDEVRNTRSDQQPAAGPVVLTSRPSGIRRTEEFFRLRLKDRHKLIGLDVPFVFSLVFGGEFSFIR